MLREGTRSPLRLATRELHRVVFALAGIGLLVGLFMGTAFSTEAPRPARVLATQALPSVVLAQTNPLVSPTRQKAATTKKARVVASVTHPGVLSPSPSPSPSPLAKGATDDSQQAEDRRLVLAAQAERPL
jgi:hypothetical protein